ncbi:MAG: Endo-beta-mannanase [Verrucomicrobiales bacterium]|nr:Endo-beta-mannanase [Verrucomicrobiales bacterium]
MRFVQLFLLPILAAAWLSACTALPRSAHSVSQSMEFVQVDKSTRQFILSRSRKAFTPWGFNYDHDSSSRLLETYWDKDWPAVERNFQEMKNMGATTVRIHLQICSFMVSETETNPASLKKLSQLVSLAEKTGLYLDLTGLAAYDKKAVPAWYNQLSEKKRWATQARFWTAVARACHQSPAIFCYDLMNEPIVNDDKTNHDWTPGELGGFSYVQRLTLDFAGRNEKQIAKAWVDQMVTAIHQVDSRHLVTVGAIPWALTYANAKPLFYSPEVSQNLDFVSLHFYPKKGQIDKALKALAVYDIGKPIVIEEMFPLGCSTQELDQFIDGSKPLARGWIGFYWGKSISDYQKEKDNLSSSITAAWLEYFVQKSPAILNQHP